MKKRWMALRKLVYEYSCAGLLLLFGALASSFYYLEDVIVPEYWVVSDLDSHIPFLPIFVIPYLIWFVFIGVGLAVLLFRDRETFVPTVWLLCAGFAAALVIFVVFPNGQLLRPSDVGDSFCGWLVANVVYANDTNTNCFPSLHVMNQLAVYLGLCRSKALANRPGVKTALGVLSVLVCASTVFIKQHSILDVLIALVLECFFYRICFPATDRVHSQSKTMANNY